MGRLVLFVFTLILMGCQSHLVVKMDKAKLIVNMKGYSKKDKKEKSAFKIYEDLTKHFFIVKDEKIIYEDLKFVKVLDAGAGETNEYSLQILDEKNHRRTIRFNSNVTTFPKYGCGTAAVMAMTSYDFSSDKKENSFNVFISRVQGFDSDPQKRLVLLENDSEKIDELLFFNLKTRYRFGDDSGVRERCVDIFFKKDKKYGIAGKIKIVEEKKKTKYSFERSATFNTFDEVTSLNGVFLLVQKNSLVGYYGVTKIKYSSLEPYVHGLARFTLPSGKSGFIDGMGREYFDK
jgi:hypothetical protein